MLAAFMSPVKFSNIVFFFFFFVRSLKFYYKTISVSRWNHLRSDFSTVNWIAESEEIRWVYSTEILLNTATIRSELDWNWLKFYGEKNTGFPTTTAPRLQTIKQTLTTSKHSIEFTYSDFLCHFKVNSDKPTLTFCRWSAKQAKDWWLPLTSGAKLIYSVEQENIWAARRIVKSWTGHECVISQSNSRI